MIRILGLDPGLAETGYGIIEVRDGCCRHVDHGAVSTSPSMSIGERLEKIQREILDVIRTFKPAQAGVESLFFAKNVTSAIPVAQARGVLLLTLSQEGVPSWEFSPPEIKLALTGNGRADKHQVQELVRILIGLSEVPRPDHAADALAAAICCFHHRFAEVRLTRGMDVQ